MTLDALPLFASRGPFSGLPIDVHLPDPPYRYFLDELEADIRGCGGPDCEADEHSLARIAEWRARLDSGDTVPRPGCWGEYHLTLSDGTPVTAVVQWPWFPCDCAVQLVEFHGDVTTTGYLSHFLSGDTVSGDLGNWLRAAAETARSEAVEMWEWERSRRPREVRTRRRRVAG